MLKSLLELYSLFDKSQKKRLIKLQFYVFFMAFSEVVGVFSIAPFMALVGDPERLNGDGLVAEIYRWSAINDPTVFLYYTGLTCLAILTTSALVSMITLWKVTSYGITVGTELSSRLYNFYMFQPWAFHANGNSSQLISNVAQETQRITFGVITPAVIINAKIMMLMFMSFGVFVVNPMVALVGFFLFSFSYYFLFHVVKKFLVINGRNISNSHSMCLRMMNEGFGGIKDTLLLGRQKNFTERFNYYISSYGTAKARNTVISQVPRYGVELLAFGVIILLVMYLLRAYEGNLGEVLPVLSVYALAGMKILPAFQQIYTSATQIQADLTAFDNIKMGLINSQRNGLEDYQNSTDKRKIVPETAVSMKNVFFRYQGAEDFLIKGLNLRISKNKTVALVGVSGSGKSTIVDLLTGLVTPDRGVIMVDEKVIDSDNLRSWQNSIGYVSQSIFLADCSIKENVAFGLSFDEIDDCRIRKSLELAHLDEFVGSLPDGVDTMVGERGVQLSGGQRQRIGIARALYWDPEILVLDEATSALDGVTEKMVIDAISDFSGKKTIIMIAHRLATVKKCDWVYFIDKGEVVDQGSYDYLYSNNIMFRRMAEHI